MSATVAVDLGAGRTARAVTVGTWDDLPAAVERLGVGEPRPVLVVVGGADLADRDLAAELGPTFAGALVPAMTAVDATGVDGGTDSGVMGVFGTALAAHGGAYRLVGVAARGTVRLPSETCDLDRPPLGPHHSHFLLVPGRSWGEESRWLARTATILSAGRPSVTVVADGGEVTYDDVGHSIAERRPVVALRGSGRTADDLTAATTGRPATARAVQLVASGLVQAHDAADHAGLAALLTGLLTTGGRAETRRGRKRTDGR